MEYPDDTAEEPASQQPARRRTALESLLDEKKTTRFAKYLCGRIESISTQLAANFWLKREVYEKQMDDDFTWRTSSGDGRYHEARNPDDALFESVGDIFDKQNDSLNIVGGFAAFMTARTCDDLFGSSPYYALNPEGMEDKELASDMQKHSEWKLHSTPFKIAATDAIDLAMGLGEGVIKVTWKTETDIYEKEASIAMVDGKPLLTSTGEYVEASDLVDYAPEPVMPEEGAENIVPLVVQVATEPMLTVSKDRTIVVPANAVTFEDRYIEQFNISYNNVDASTMYYRDFLCPETAKSIEDSDFIGHRFQRRLDVAVTEFNIPDDIAAKLRAKGCDDEPQAEVAKPRETSGEVAEADDETDYVKNPLIKLVECWVKYDPVGDGRVRKIRAIVAPEIETIISMDYMANVTPKGQLPFFCVRAYRVKNRWYGKGYYETYENAQEFIDRQLNRIEYRNRYHANPIPLIDQSQLETGEETQDFEFKPGGRAPRLRPGADLEKAFRVIELPDLDERTWQLMQFMIQVIQVRSGVTSAAQGQVSSMPSTATATGIESILASASVLARLPMGNIRDDLEDALLYGVTLIYANFDRDEVFTYFEGDEQKARTLEAARVENISMNVRLLLTRFKQRESAENALKAIDIGGRYVTLPEPEKAAQRSLFIQALKGIGIEDADDIIRQPVQMQALPQPAEGVPGEVMPPPPAQDAQPAA